MKLVVELVWFDAGDAVDAEVDAAFGINPGVAPAVHAADALDHLVLVVAAEDALDFVGGHAFANLGDVVELVDADEIGRAGPAAAGKVCEQHGAEDSAAKWAIA